MAKTISTTRFTPIVEIGQRPPAAHQHPRKGTPALWRGKAAGGNDDGGYEVETTGRVPNDEVVRSSTLPG